MDLSGQFSENESGDDNGPSIASMREATTARIVASRDARAAREAESTAKYKERRASREIVSDPITGGLSRGGQPLSYGPNRATLATLRNIHATITDPSGNVVHKRDDSSTGRLMGDTLSAVTGRKEGAVASDETSEVYTASQAREMRTAPTAGDDVKQSAGFVNRPNIIGEQAAKRGLPYRLLPPLTLEYVYVEKGFLDRPCPHPPRLVAGFRQLTGLQSLCVEVRRSAPPNQCPVTTF
jgi:hypothetical protein